MVILWQITYCDRGVSNSVTIAFHHAVINLLQTQHDLYQRCFATTIGTDDTNKIVSVNVKRNTAKHGLAIIRGADI